MNNKITETQLESFKNSFWGFLSGRMRLTIIVLIGIVLWGTLSYLELPQENNPEIEIPRAFITTIYPGATSTDIEKLITDKLEEKIVNLDKIQVTKSSSQEGVSTIDVKFQAEADLKDSLRKLREAVNDSKSELPDEAEDPVITEVDFANMSIVNFSLIGPKFRYSELLSYAKTIEKELERISSIRDVTINGKRNLEISIKINPHKLESYNLNLNQIQQAIKANHLNLPIGSIYTNNLNYQVRLVGEFQNSAELSNIIIAKNEQNVIYLKDISEIQEKYSTETSINRLSINGKSPEATITLSVFKKAGGNIINTVDLAKNKVTEIQGSIIPSKADGLSIEVTNDQSTYIKQDFNALKSNALETVILIFIVLFFALGIKEAFIASLAIPLTFLITFGVLSYTGNTLNMMTLFSLVLGLGLLVDTAIVIMEGIHESIYEKKLKPLAAIYDTLTIYKTSLISGTGTTVAAFVPMLLMSGVIGQFFSYIPITVTTVLVTSLLISLLILPAIAAWMMKPSDLVETRKSIFYRLILVKNKVIDFINSYYKIILKKLMNSRIHRIIWITTLIIGFSTAMALPALDS